MTALLSAKAAGVHLIAATRFRTCRSVAGTILRPLAAKYLPKR